MVKPFNQAIPDMGMELYYGIYGNYYRGSFHPKWFLCGYQTKRR